MKTPPATSSQKTSSDFPRIVPKFPPEITPKTLIQKAIGKYKSLGQTSRIPNAFIAYRVAFCKELRSMKHPVITQPQLSSMAKQSWLNEPEAVRKEYQRIALEAKDLYKHLVRMNLPARLEREKNLQLQAQKLNNNKNSQFIRIETPASPSQSLQSSPVSEVEDYVDRITVPSSDFHSSVDENEQSSLGHQISSIYDYSPTFNVATYTNTFYTSPPLENDLTYESSYFPNPFQPEISSLDDYNQTQISSSPYFSTNYDFIDQFGSSNYIEESTISSNLSKKPQVGLSTSSPSSPNLCGCCKKENAFLKNRVKELESQLASLTSGQSQEKKA
ncbi:12320_t:CDS:1 [Ambispora leptoticha]|uniref:12320_t:CDS:1 n=1 Tax=Ambispora leptoticha TaxID=144679 RepID=A0A9N9A3X1_9GLOM|nr:12320_t:CDS:1 [Ambispora leptoticha]